MKKTIELGHDFKINLPVLMETRALIQANSGGGKSWLLRRLLEQTHGQVQQIVIDLEGEFYTLREKFDYVLVGESGDVPISLRSATLLAQRLLKLKANAIIDLSELQKHERKPFVRLFLEALMEARSPKDYHTPCIVVIDEAHQFAPETGESEASAAVIDIMTRGRKRQFCGILATQRISKLSKDAAAECNNKIIGRCALDLDMKRGAEELAFNTKEEQRTLRTLAPGEFYAFGTALTPEVEKVHSGAVLTSPKPKKSAGKTRVIPAPQSAIKTMLKELGDLPKEVETKAKTEAELRKEIGELKAQLKNRPAEKPVETVMGVSQWLNYGAKYGYADFFEKKIAAKVVRAAITKRDKQWEENSGQWKAYARRLKKVLSDASTLLKRDVDSLIANGGVLLDEAQMPPPVPAPEHFDVPAPPPMPAAPVVLAPVKTPERELRYTGGMEFEVTTTLGKGEATVLKAIAGEDEGITREHLTIVTGYKKSTRNRYVQYLTAKMFVREEGERLFATQQGVEVLGPDFERLPTGSALRERLLTTLPEGERRILSLLCENYPSAVERESISANTGYQKSTRNRYIQYLQARQLVVATGTAVSASPKLYD